MKYLTHSQTITGEASLSLKYLNVGVQTLGGGGSSRCRTALERLTVNQKHSLLWRVNSRFSGASVRYEKMPELAKLEV
jgi:hypothetical protein